MPTRCAKRVIRIAYTIELGYAEDRRLATAKNPEATSYDKQWEYYDDGTAKSLTLEDDLGKTEWLYDDLNREDARRRYTGSSRYETWDLTPGVQLDLATQMADPDSKDIDWVWDDLGRKVKQITPDSGTTLYNYDAAGNLTMIKEAYGTGGEVEHTFGYDYANRQVAADYGSINCGAGQGAEIQYTYDEVAGGCPAGAACENQAGRLAMVKTKMWCDSAKADKTFDQFTYFSYDDAGRVVEEHIADDGRRVAELGYVWDKNGNNGRVSFPDGTQMNTAYGDTANSDQDDIIELARGGTDLVTSGKWYPFGPIEEYQQENVSNSNKIWARFEWDLAHRAGSILYEEDTSGSDLFQIAYTKDYAGRTTVRDFSSAHASVQDAYYTYDMMSHVTCDSGTSGSCPPHGSDLKTNMAASPPYTPGGDRKTMIHASPSGEYGTYTYTTTLKSGADQLKYVDGGRCRAYYYWDARGNRTKDDCTDKTSDQRDYVYDGRGNVLTVTGEYLVGIPGGGTYHDYTLTNAYDERNRRIFKSFVDESETCGGANCEAQWFFYYDVYDRLVMVKHTPDISDTSEYSIYEFFWIGQRPVAYYQIDYPGPTTTRRFIHADELNRPLDVWSWPTSGSAARVWAINPDLFGWDYVVTGSSVYQPLRFPGQYVDEETRSTYGGTMGTYPYNARPPLHENRHRYYDPYTGTYLQVDPKVEDTWEAYNYVDQGPVMRVDPTGLYARFADSLNPWGWGHLGSGFVGADNCGSGGWGGGDSWEIEGESHAPWNHGGLSLYGTGDNTCEHWWVDLPPPPDTGGIDWHGTTNATHHIPTEDPDDVRCRIVYRGCLTVNNCRGICHDELMNQSHPELCAQCKRYCLDLYDLCRFGEVRHHPGDTVEPGSEYPNGQEPPQ